MQLTPSLPPHLSRRLATLATTLAAAFAGLACGAPEADAARGMEIALQDDAVIVSERWYDREKALRRARAFGVTRIRINVQWAFVLPRDQQIARSKPATLSYQWGQVDQAIDAAARYGMRTYLSLTGPAPAWAAGDRRVGPVRPDAAAFADFARAAAQHFRGRVDRYSIWNEPNVRPWLSPLGAAPHLYRSLYRRGYAAIKAVSPGAKVLFAETSPYGSRIGGRKFASPPIAFLRSALCVNRRWRRSGRCPGLRADGYAHHPYDFRHAANYRFPGRDNATMGTLRNLTRALDRLSRSGALRKNGGGRMPLYLTEYGYFATGHRSLPKRRRTRYLAQGWNIALRNSRVKSNLQYLIASPPRRSGFAYFNLALLTTGGRKYPQYNTLVSWYRQHRRKVKRPGSPLRLPPAPR